HRVLRQRLKMLPAAQRAEPTELRDGMHGKIAAIALTEGRPLGMRRPQLTALGNGLSIGGNQPLGDVEAATVALAQTEHNVDSRLLGRLADALGLWAVVGQRVVEVPLHESTSNRPRRRAQPDVPWIPR